VNISPGEVHALPPEIRHDFLLAFVHALQPVFLVAAALTAVTFLLALLLEEVPLRATTSGAADLEAAQAVAGGSAAEALAQGPPRPRERVSPGT
jgi:hypothetical protein